jgi:hypothetical protein
MDSRNGSVADENCPARDALKLLFERPESRRLHMTAYGPIAVTRGFIILTIEQQTDRVSRLQETRSRKSG